MAKKQQRQWVYSPPKPAKPSIPAELKAEVEAKAQPIVAGFKLFNVQPPPADPQFNYLIDIWTKWYRGYFYFCGTYASPFPNALSPKFEVRFARMTFVAIARSTWPICAIPNSGKKCFPMCHLRKHLK